MKAVEKEKDALEGPKDEALQYLILENDISLMKSKLYQKYMYETQSVIIDRTCLHSSIVYSRLYIHLSEICSQTVIRN